MYLMLTPEDKDLLAKKEFKRRLQNNSGLL